MGIGEELKNLNKLLSFLTTLFILKHILSFYFIIIQKNNIIKYYFRLFSMDNGKHNGMVNSIFF